MSDYHEDMKASKARRENAKLVPDVYAFPPKTALKVSDAVRKYAEADDLEVRIHLGLNDKGEAEGFAEVWANGESHYCGNLTSTCPPRTDCN